MVAPKNNEWGSDYSLARCLEGKQTILEPITNDENIEFPTGSMVIGDSMKVGNTFWPNLAMKTCFFTHVLDRIH